MSVLSVSLSPTHTFSKAPLAHITLPQNLGVEGDCHLGPFVQHRSRLHIRPAPANLRQVHIIHSELFEEFASTYEVRPGELGENITTKGVDLLGLGKGTRLIFVNEGEKEVEGEGEERKEARLRW